MSRAPDGRAAASPPARADAASPGVSLSCEAVAFSYQEARERLPALRDVTFSLRTGGSLALLGASGAGKSTLLQVIKGLDEVESGTVVLDGLRPGDDGYVRARRQTGLVFQTAELQLFAASAWEDVAFGPRRLGWDETRVREAVDDALELVGLPPAVFAERHPYALSGGERRRLALAGVLAMRPRLLLLDEPFVSLDPRTRRDLVAVLGRLRSAGVTCVLATHDIDLAWALCDEHLVLRRGEVVAAGAWDFGPSGGLDAAGRLREPFLVQLWRRLGRDPGAAPRTVEAAAEALA